MLYLKPLAFCRSPTALKRPDRSKQCHCLQFCYVEIVLNIFPLHPNLFCHYFYEMCFVSDN